jgi:carbamoyltransferase
MRILGLSSFRYDTSAALLIDGRFVAAIEDAKLARTPTHGLPEAAIRFCLDSAGLSWHDLDAVAVATLPVRGWARRSWGAASTSPFSPVAGAYYEANELGDLARDLSNLRILRHKSGTSPCRFLNFEHHLCYAASSFYLSPFDRALILTLDEEGDGRAGMIALGEGTRIRPLKTISFPHSLGWVYARITELLGFVPQKEEHKTQWLSLEGEPLFKQVFLEMLGGAKGSVPSLDSSFVHRGVTGDLALSGRFYRQLGIPEGGAPLGDDLRRALASSVQHACTEIVAELVEHYRKREGVEQVCLGGGLFQNVLLVSDLEKRLGMGKVFIPPAPGNSGSALGAATLVWHQSNSVRCEPNSHSYWGPGFRAHEVKDILDNSKARYQIQNTSEEKFDSTIKLLQAGKIVGWFQGRAEFGPRALGNRSLLASPWAPYVKENLNDFVKHREWFRPFAISVPEEDCARYFDSSPLCGSMNSLATVRTSGDGLPPDFCLPGNRIRLHAVSRKSNPLFWGLLKQFGKHGRAPMLLNTSFNLSGEPLVARPQDAVRSYFCSGIDALVMENFLLLKATATHVLAADARQLAIA